MATKLSAFFTIIAVAVMVGTFLSRKAMLLPQMSVNALFSQAIIIVFAYFMIGIFLARLGISLIHEVIEEKRSRVDQKVRRACSLYQQLLSDNSADDEDMD